MYEQYDNSEWSETATEYGINKSGQIYYMKRDPDAIRLQRPIPPELRHVFEEGKKVIQVSVYPSSSTPLYRIRNAVTGMYYPKYKVGTLDEDRFFKVCWAMGNVSRSAEDEGTKIGPLTLFFNDPEECEKHMLTKISAETKAGWRARQIAQYRKDKKFQKVEDDGDLQKLIHNEFRRVILVK